MNLILVLLALLSVSSFLGCQEKTPDAACSDAGNFVKRGTNINGRVFYDSTEAKYMILVPNSMDSHDVGFVCSLDKKYQSQGAKVKFSGRYYEYSKTLQRFAGDRFYSLTLDSVSPGF